MDHFAPLCEASAHDFPVGRGGHQLATGMKERCDHSEGREKPLGVSGRLEAPHATFSFSRWLMGIFCAIVRSVTSREWFRKSRRPEFSHNLFDIALAEAEAKVQPHAVADDLGR